MASIRIYASGADGTTLKQFSEILAQRMKYMNETARDAVAACALNVLKSIRTATLVAKPSRVKVELKVDNSLYFSYSTRGKKHAPCVRVKGSGARYAGTEKMVLSHTPTPGADKTWHVYRFEDEYSKAKTQYLIPSPNMALAKQKAKSIAQKRLMRYAGLARRAIGMLMQKAFTKGVADAVAPHVTAKANEVTRKSETVSKNA